VNTDGISPGRERQLSGRSRAGFHARREALVIPLLFFLLGTVMMDRQGAAFLGPYLVRNLHLLPSQVGLVSGATSIAWAISAVVFGVLSDRIGRKVILIPAVLSFSLLCCLTGLTTTFEQLLLVRVLLGLAEGPCFSIIMAIAASHSTPAQQGRDVGMILSAGPLIGTTLGPMLGVLVADHLGWRFAFTALGLPGLLLAFLVFFFVEEPPRHGEGRTPTFFADLGSLFRYRELMLVQLAAMGFMGWLICHLVYGPLYVTETAHQAPRLAGFLLGATGIGSFLYSMFGTSAFERFGPRRVLVIYSLMSALVPLGFMFVDLYVFYPWAAWLCLCVTNSSAAVAAFLLFLLPMRAVPERLRGSAMGLTSFTSEIFGSTLAPVAGGFLADTMGFSAPLYLGAACIGVAALFGALACGRLFDPSLRRRAVEGVQP
jgi:predicted MFS family arabinose efflux permease